MATVSKQIRPQPAARVDVSRMVFARWKGTGAFPEVIYVAKPGEDARFLEGFIAGLAYTANLEEDPSQFEYFTGDNLPSPLWEKKEGTDAEAASQ